MTKSRNLKNLKKFSQDFVSDEFNLRNNIKDKNFLSDMKLFRESIGKVNPLIAKSRVIHLLERPLPIAEKRIADDKSVIQESISDEFNPETILEIDDNLSYARNGVSRDILKKLRNGKWVIQDQLDLHGLRSNEAKEAVVFFLKKTLTRQNRCVRIIHGKGLRSKNKIPILKVKLRNWLIQIDEVMAFCQARGFDGGSGALIVLLKSKREKK